MPIGMSERSSRALSAFVASRFSRAASSWRGSATDATQFMGREQIPVSVGGKTYFGCCAMCKEKLEKNEAVRMRSGVRRTRRQGERRQAGAGPHHNPAACPERAALVEPNARRPCAKACAGAKERARPRLGTAATGRFERIRQHVDSMTLRNCTALFCHVGLRHHFLQTGPRPRCRDADDRRTTEAAARAITRTPPAKPQIGSRTRPVASAQPYSGTILSPASLELGSPPR